VLVARLASIVAVCAFALIVVAGLDIEQNSLTACTGPAECSAWDTLSRASGPVPASHLTVALLTGVSAVVLVAATWFRLREDRRVLSAGAATLLLILLQLASLSLSASAAAAIHLGATALLLALALYLALMPTLERVHSSSASTGATTARHTRVPDARLVHVSLALVFAILVSGAYLAGGERAGTCEHWPLCGSTTPIADAGAWDSHLVHRGFVLAGAAALVALAIGSARAHRRSRWGVVVLGTLLALFGVEIVVGALSATGSASALVAGTHFATAGIAWSLLVVLALAGSAERVRSVADRPSIAAPHSSVRAAAQDYARVTKPGIMLLLLATTLGAMLVADAGWPSLPLVVATMLGGALASGGASALNCYFDRDIDAVMARTRRRPLPTGRLTAGQVRDFGLLLSVLAVVELALLVNVTAAALALAGNLFYVVIYTRWLKRATPQNIVIGGAAGAFPPLVGWAAVTGTVTLPALLLFAIVFYWTPPHFWSLALLKARDYERASVPMLPVTHGEHHTRRSILLYAVLLVAVTLLLVPAGAAGAVYLSGAILLGAIFVALAARMYLEGTSRLAWRLFKYSNYYLALLLALLVIDHALAW
jgi:protoheme IX farnesyltransferase